MSAMTAGCLFAGAVYAGGPLRISDGVIVTMEYTMRMTDDTVVESNVGKTPLSFIQGSHSVVPGLENAVSGLKAGDSLTVFVPKEEGYGPYSPMKKIRVPREKAPSGVKAGATLVSPDGTQRVKVLEVHDTWVMLDFNHPLAGKDLTFEIKILNVEAP